MDPLVFSGVRFEANSRVKLEALIDPAILGALLALRTARKVKPENTAQFLGMLISEAVIALENRGVVTRKEKASTQLVRWAVGTLLTMGQESVSQPRIVAQAGLTGPTVRQAVRELEADGILSSAPGRDGTSGRATWLYGLTMKGIQTTAADHPSEEIRFTLGGMSPPVPVLGPFPASGPYSWKEQRQAAKVEAFTAGLVNKAMGADEFARRNEAEAVPMERRPWQRCVKCQTNTIPWDGRQLGPCGTCGGNEVDRG